MPCGLLFISRLWELSRFPSSTPAIALGPPLFSRSMKQLRGRTRPHVRVRRKARICSPYPNDEAHSLRRRSRSGSRYSSCPAQTTSGQEDAYRSGPDHKDLLTRPTPNISARLRSRSTPRPVASSYGSVAVNSPTSISSVPSFMPATTPGTSVTTTSISIPAMSATVSISGIEKPRPAPDNSEYDCLCTREAGNLHNSDEEKEPHSLAHSHSGTDA